MDRVLTEFGKDLNVNRKIRRNRRKGKQAFEYIEDNGGKILLLECIQNGEQRGAQEISNIIVGILVENKTEELKIQ